MRYIIKNNWLLSKPNFACSKAQYFPFGDSKFKWFPVSTITPFSITKIVSELAIVINLCAITITVFTANLNLSIVSFTIFYMNSIIKVVIKNKIGFGSNKTYFGLTKINFGIFAINNSANKINIWFYS